MKIFCPRVKYHEAHAPGPSMPLEIGEPEQREAIKVELADCEEKLERLREQKGSTLHAPAIERLDVEIEAAERRLKACGAALSNISERMRAYAQQISESQRDKDAIMRRLAEQILAPNDFAAFGVHCTCEGLEAELDECYRSLARAEYSLRHGAGSSKNFYLKQASEARNKIKRLERELEQEART